MTWIDRIGGRKYTMTLGCGLATTVLQFTGKLDASGSTYAMVIIATVGVYIGGNVVQKKIAPKDDE